MFKVKFLRKLKFLNVFASCLYSILPILFVAFVLFLLGFDVASASSDRGCTAAEIQNGTPGCVTLWNVQGAMAGTSWFSLKMIYLVSAICGLLLMVTSLVTFKSAGEAGQQQGNNHTKKGIVIFILGGSMFSLPFIGNVSQNSFLQSGITTGGGFVVPSVSSAYDETTGAAFWASNNPSG